MNMQRPIKHFLLLLAGLASVAVAIFIVIIAPIFLGLVIGLPIVAIRFSRMNRTRRSYAVAVLTCVLAVAALIFCIIYTWKIALIIALSAFFLNLLSQMIGDRSSRSQTYATFTEIKE